MSAIEVLPKNGNVQEWNDQEKALVEAAGLVSRGNLAPRPTVEAFLQHCRRTGLDPIARQIYAIERGGKWGIQISIDGARLVAERSKEYRGQTPAQWTADGKEWLDVWIAKEPPAAARVGIHREGFVEPLMTVATWDQYAQPNSPMWKKMPALMLAKCAEALALRKAFPQDLSGLYTSEEMDQATPQQQAAPRQAPARAPQVAPAPTPAPAAPEPETVDAEVVEESAFDAEHWVDRLMSAADVDQLRQVWDDATAAEVLNQPMDATGTALGAMIQSRRARLIERAEQ